MAGEIAPILTALYSFYNVIFQPLLALGPYVSLGFFSVCLAGLFSLIYWHFLNIERADELKEKMNHHQDKMKEARSNDMTEKASEHMKKSMEVNQELMKENFKPMIGTMVFVALVFPWLGATFAPAVQLEPVQDNQSMQTYKGNFSYANQITEITVQNSSEQTKLIVDNQEALQGESVRIQGFEWAFKGIKEKNPGLFSNKDGTFATFNGKFVNLPFSLPFIGGALNWLGFYILIAMPLTYIFRKVLGVA